MRPRKNRFRVSRIERKLPTDRSGRDSGPDLGPHRVSLFGGTFDPIHDAHLQIATAAIEKFSLHRVLFVPARNPPHKHPSGVTPYKHRLRMVEIACRVDPRFIASRLEEGSGPSYTIDTLERFRKELRSDDRLFFLIGSDAFDEIESWKRWQDVIRLTEFIVVTRPEHEYCAPEQVRVHRLDGVSLPVSSSSIRNRLAAGQSTPELPSGVRAYIETHGLYGFGQTATVLP